jgi:hypothetical protein
MFRRAVAKIIKSTSSSVTVHTMLWCVLVAWNGFQYQRIMQVIGGFDIELPEYTIILIELWDLFFEYPVALLLLLIIGVAVDVFVFRLLKQEKSLGLRRGWFWLMALIPALLFIASCFALAEILLFALKDS